MRLFQKSIAYLCALALLLCMIPATVFAQEDAATVGQGIGQIYNAATNSNTFREDNILRSGAESIGRGIGGDTGAAVGGALYDGAITTASLYASAYSIANYTLTPKAPPPNPGASFEPGKTGIQIGVNPNTLTPAKDLTTLSPLRLKDAIKYAGDHAVTVGRTGIIHNGHHKEICKLKVHLVPGETKWVVRRSGWFNGIPQQNIPIGPV